MPHEKLICDTKEACAIGVLIIRWTTFSDSVLAKSCVRKLSGFCSCSYHRVESHGKLFKLRHKGDYSCWWTQHILWCHRTKNCFQPTHCYQPASNCFACRWNLFGWHLSAVFLTSSTEIDTPWNSGSNWLNVRVTRQAFKTSILGHPTSD